MAKDASFDVVSEVDMQEVDNAVNQAGKEISQRYDFKGSNAKIEVVEETFKLTAEDEYKVQSIYDVLQSKLIKRKVPIQNLVPGKIEPSGKEVKQTVEIRQGIDKETAKKIVKDIKGAKLKVQAQIMDEQVRVSGKNRDDLQAVIALLKDKDYGCELQFTNYR